MTGPKTEQKRIIAQQEEEYEEDWIEENGPVFDNDPFNVYGPYEEPLEDTPEDVFDDEEMPFY
ncbi:MAG: hypothetical protein K6E34_04220 [Lachnospiraceae bacterium]|nr:hypothetical protein [Lachnospiraceae bacterium]